MAPAQINIQIESLRHHWCDRSEFYCGGNLFIYYSLEQARHRDYRGLDFFVVLSVDGSHSREAWVEWEEGGRWAWSPTKRPPAEPPASFEFPAIRYLLEPGEVLDTPTVAL